MSKTSDITFQFMEGSIFIRVPGGYGDNLMATSVIAAIAQEHPDWKIFVATRHQDIFDNNPHVAACYHATKLKKQILYCIKNLFL